MLRGMRSIGEGEGEVGFELSSTSSLRKGGC